ncbi:hypothetical protein [Pyrobaculum neutrophilum]|uniref:Family 453 n=1 Tax=Pyrobaculum neutrophilum (strain DSM 2338 / JCM 9278 / NBRC 100436 / V24Sta) TaxID=444157 RepID=B1Y8X6_PYRNV|nr:hypothetical protein [Pyrobaculum neutrophilum]ACB40205.1 family 453 [Pyrobaculum neutrophilum V24Sta]
MDAVELFREFYLSLGMPLRAIIEYRMRRRGATVSDLFERPYLLYFYVSQDLGPHNAELIVNLFVDFARRRRIDSKVAGEALRSPDGWRRFVQYLEGL